MNKSELFFIVIFDCIIGMILSFVWFIADWKVTLFDCMVWGVVLSVITNEYTVRSRIIKEEKLLKEFERFLTLVRHGFNAHGMVDEAVCDAVEACNDRRLRKLFEEIYEVIKDEKVNARATEFRSRNKNPFMGLFLTLCMTVIEHGDKRADGHSMFLLNIKNLKDELNTEILGLRMSRFRFSGMTLVILLPLISLRIIEKWGMGNIDELGLFYLGKRGLLVKIIILIFTCLTYVLINEMRKTSRTSINYEKRINISPGKKIDKVIKQYLSGHEIKAARIKKLLNESGNRMDCQSFILFQQIFVCVIFLFCFCVSLVVTEKSYGLIQISIVTICTAASYYLPEVFMIYRRRLIKGRMDEEVMQFQSVIMILMHTDRVSTLQLLEEIESFAVFFRKLIRECINDYQTGDIDALVTLKNNSGCEAMEQIAENFIMSDSIGVEAAFEEIIPERNYNREKRKQENQISMDRKVVLAKLIAFIPMFITMSGYLIIPFITESMKKMEGLMI